MQNPETLHTQDLKPLIFFHGGSWIYRSLTSTVAVDAITPNLTRKGYVVFAPMYRLLNNRSGPKECQNSSGEDILSDTLDALEWVKENKHHFATQQTTKRSCNRGALIWSSPCCLSLNPQSK